MADPDTNHKLEKDISNYEKDKKVSKSDFNISVKSVSIPKSGAPSIVVAFNGGKYSLARKGDVVLGVEITDIKNNLVKIRHKGKSHIVYVQ